MIALILAGWFLVSLGVSVLAGACIKFGSCH